MLLFLWFSNTVRSKAAKSFLNNLLPNVLQRKKNLNCSWIPKKKLAKTEIKLHFLTIFFFPTYEPCWLTSTTTTVKTLFLSHSSSICHQEEETIVSFSQELRKSLVIVIKAPFTHFSQRKRNEVAHWLAFPLQWETLGITMFENHSKCSLIQQ